MSRVRKAARPAGLPPPTPSEAAFERVLAAMSQGTDAVVVRKTTSKTRIAVDDAQGAPVAEALAPAASLLDGADSIDSTTADAVLDELFAKSREYLLDRYSTIGDASGFNSKVVGVSFEGRQAMVQGLRGGEEVQLIRHPENPKDPNAIGVWYGVLQLGFLRKEIARRLAPNIDGGQRYTAKVTEVTGGGTGKHVGVNIYVRRMPDSVPTVRVVREVEGDARDADAIRAALIGEHPLREAQIAVLERVRRGDSTLAVFGTGRGKSLCFQLPAAERALGGRGKTLVFYPLRALANDQHNALMRKLAPLGVRIHRANGAIDDEERAELDAVLESGDWDIILSTPEFAEYHREAFTRACNRPSLVVVDEAHHAFGAKHRPAYVTLGALVRALGAPQVLGLTATAGDETFAHVRRALGIERWVIDPTVRENLEVVDARGSSDKVGYIRNNVRSDEKAIVYCNSRPEATKIAERLRGALGNVVAFYHAGMPSEKRFQVEDMFRSGAVRIVAATTAFGEGIDLPDVRHVFLYHMNFSFTEFNQQAGRSGRDGFPAQIHLLYGQQDRALNDFIIGCENPTIGTLRELYRGMRGLAGPDGLRMTYEDISRTLDLNHVKGETVSAAVRIFEEAGLVATGKDDDGRFVRFLESTGKVDLTQTTRFAEGQATRDDFERFCKLALEADAETLEAIINRPIYPDDVPLSR